MILSFSLELSNDSTMNYVRELETVARNDPQMIMCVVSNNSADRYASIKKKLCIERAIPSQVMLLKNVAKANPSVATKVILQMNTKLGHAPWKVQLPLSGLMTIGFDVCHDTRNRSLSFGAFIASMDQNRSDVYFSRGVAHRNGEELSNSFGQMTLAAVKCYMEIHGEVPKMIVVYRDGVGEGQFQFVVDHEVRQLLGVLEPIYAQHQKPLKMSFIVVTKRINTRVFAGDRNPPPGTVIDDVITLPERYDFYLVAQDVNQGTATPSNYNVIHDTTGLKPDHIQMLTYKLCHLYYNWTGTVRVPHVCQYAHKLSLLLGQYFHEEPNQQLEKKLYFL